MCKKAVAKGQLKGKGIGCFVQRGGKTVFKQCTTEAAMAAKTSSKGAKLFIIQVRREETWLLATLTHTQHTLAHLLTRLASHHDRTPSPPNRLV